MAGKWTAGVGILIAAGLIVWAVTSPGGDEEVPALNPTPMSDTARFAAGGAATAAAMLLAQPLPGIPPALDEEALRELMAEYLSEAGLDFDPGQVQRALAQFQSIASQAQSLLNRAAADPSLLAGRDQSLDPSLLLSLLASQGLDPQILGQRASQAGAPFPIAPPPPRAAPAAPPPFASFGTGDPGIDKSTAKSDLSDIKSDLSAKMRSDFTELERELRSP